MASSSIFIYELRSPSEINVESIYSCLKGYPEDENTYFNLEMISANELLGEYVIVQNVQESYYNPEQRVFEYRIVPKANVISFSITDGFLEIWGNKTSANKLVFELSNLLAPISINSVEVTIDTLLEKLKGYKLKVSKVCFQDFLFTEDIVGNFTVDLSSYALCHEQGLPFFAGIFLRAGSLRSSLPNSASAQVLDPVPRLRSLR